MKINKRLGIYLNYQQANLIEFTSNPLETKTVDSDFTHEEKLETIQKGEKAMHHKEQHEQLAYFKKLGEVIKQYDEVLLFGPTKAKNELYNLLLGDNHFNKIDVTIVITDEITLKEQQDTVMQYFSKKLTKPTL
jgi:hypothetical protein